MSTHFVLEAMLRLVVLQTLRSRYGDALLNQAQLAPAADQLALGREAELSVDVRQVCLHGPPRQEELFRHLTRGHPVRRQASDLALPVAQDGSPGGEGGGPPAAAPQRPQPV